MTQGIRLSLTLRRRGFTLDTRLEIPGRGVTALFGPSGSGKTTLLRCLAGLEPDARGTLEVNGHCWQDSERGVFVPTHRRGLGYVFQDAHLFPHLSVHGNLAYGWRRAGRRGPEPATVAKWLGVHHLLHRRPARLSGGERQRVAIARAVLAGPRLVLMDEPLASLDRAGKGGILPYLERLHGELEIPVIYVSHDADEVARLADHLVWMDAGAAPAAAPLGEMLTRMDLPLSHGDAAGAVLNARVATVDDEFALSYLDSPAGRITVPGRAGAPGAAVRVRIHARDVSLALAAPSGTSVLNILPATVLELSPDGPAQMLVKLSCGEAVLLSRITRKSCVRLALGPGTSLYAQVKSVALVG